jgi:hypothetical protein
MFEHENMLYTREVEVTEYYVVLLNDWGHPEKAIAGPFVDITDAKIWITNAPDPKIDHKYEIARKKSILELEFE